MYARGYRHSFRRRRKETKWEGGQAGEEADSEKERERKRQIERERENGWQKTYSMTQNWKRAGSRKFVEVPMMLG